MFEDIAPVYDLVKSHRDYAAEADAIRGLIRQHAPGATSVLDVACGTGSLLAQLGEFERAGVDVSAPMLDQARKKLGDAVTLHQARMEELRLPRPAVDVLLCLDGALGYVGSGALGRTLSAFARHLVTAGLLVVEPWFTPETWEPGNTHVTHHSDGAVTVVRASYGHPDGRIDFHTVIGTSTGLRTFDERYDFTLHSEPAMAEALHAGGFTDVRKEAAPGFGRGLLVAHKR
ncbi:class I SAM-dependent DNA methyltransferase [Streptomyces triculaminicus]|uniref:class I SAM-dependent DNA methyltransferase n=1 Tax=Streptomyces triculaminicus TaxID=2816232 RepID=UPI0037D5A374